ARSAILPPVHQVRPAQACRSREGPGGLPVNLAHGMGKPSAAHRHQQPQAQGAGGHPRADQRDECYFYRTTAALKNPIRIYPQLIENIRAWPIHKVYEDREGLIETVDRLTLQHILDKHGERIGDLISRVSYLEL